MSTWRQLHGHAGIRRDTRFVRYGHAEINMEHAQEKEKRTRAEIGRLMGNNNGKNPTSVEFGRFPKGKREGAHFFFSSGIHTF